MRAARPELSETRHFRRAMLGAGAKRPLAPSVDGLKGRLRAIDQKTHRPSCCARRCLLDNPGPRGTRTPPRTAALRPGQGASRTDRSAGNGFRGSCSIALRLSAVRTT